MNLLAGKRDPLDFVVLALRSSYFFFPGKLIVNHKTLKKYQLAVRKRNRAFLKIWSLSTPDSGEDMLVKENTRSEPTGFANSLKVVLSFVFILLFGLKNIIEGFDETCTTPTYRCGCGANSFTFQYINKALY